MEYRGVLPWEHVEGIITNYETNKKTPSTCQWWRKLHQVRVLGHVFLSCKNRIKYIQWCTTITVQSASTMMVKTNGHLKFNKFVFHSFIFSQELLTYFSMSVNLLGVTWDYVMFNNVWKILMLLPGFYSNKY